jgi:hypothetical protein
MMKKNKLVIIWLIYFHDNSKYFEKKSSPIFLSYDNVTFCFSPGFISHAK